MTGIRRIFTITHRDERGLGLPEMLVAMVIFALISTGVLYGLLAMLQLSRESRAIQVAANLAAEEIDLVRGVDDIFTLVDATRTVELNGDQFEVRRIARWVSDPGLDLDCGSGGQPLRYKRVAVEVRWDNMRDADNPVASYTIVDPDNRINDPSLGTILVNVINASGTGTSGVSVNAVPASPANGALPLGETPSPTDAQGCTYILKATPGNYTVTLSRAGYVDADQQATPSRIVGVEAGAAGSAGFLYDQGATFRVNYASNRPAGQTPLLPTNLVTSFVSTYGIHQSTQTAQAQAGTLRLFPFASGYEVIPGAFVEPSDGSDGCVNVDPAAWEPRVEGGQTFVGERSGPAAAAPGGSAPVVDVPMGIVDLSVSTANANRYIRAQSIDDGGPGCSIVTNFVFDRGGSSSRTNPQRIALPYGTWRFFTGNASSQNTAVPGLAISPVTEGAVSNSLIGALLVGVVTLDPRTVVQ
ncbi:MAG: prepilin-type N-terminal cleavage/methylation domain-containing protein [Microcella sp.]